MPKLEIIELTCEKREGKSEGQLLIELLRIIGFKEEQARLRDIKSKTEFVDALQNTTANYLHIASHGYSKEGVTRLQIQRKYRRRFLRVSSKDIMDIDRQGKPSIELSILSACYTGHQDMIDAFTHLGSTNIIAPKRVTYWDYCAAFSTLLYEILLSEERSPWVAYKRALKGMDAAFPRIAGRWRFFKNGRLVEAEQETMT